MVEKAFLKFLKNIFSDKTVNVYVMMGLPGSGKDTFLARILALNADAVSIYDSNNEWHKICLKSYNEKLPVVLSRDDIRSEIGLCKAGDKCVGTKSEENRVTEIFNERLLRFANENRVIFINNINLHKWNRDKIHEVLDSADIKYKLTIIYIEAPSFADNISRRQDQISENVLTKMKNTMNWPKQTEYDGLIVLRNFNVNELILRFSSTI